jgi:hypothetical protein
MCCTRIALHAYARGRCAVWFCCDEDKMSVGQDVFSFLHLRGQLSSRCCEMGTLVAQEVQVQLNILQHQYTTTRFAAP